MSFKKFHFRNLAFSLVVLSNANLSFAGVVEGQNYSTNGLHCGGQVRDTGTCNMGTVSFNQYSWIYYNCAGATVRRKANIKWAPDGNCHGIRGKHAKVIAVTCGSSHFQGSKECD